MEWKDVTDTIKQYAPGVTSLLGVASLIPGVGAITGPAALAVGAIAKALGTEPTPDAIQQAIVTDPNAALKLKQADLDFQLAQQKEDHEHEIRERDQQLSELKVRLDDVKSARNMKVKETEVTGKRDTEDKFFDWFIILGFFIILGAVMYFKPPESTNLGMLIGATITAFTSVVHFRRGTSQGSIDKTNLLAKAEPIKQ